MLIKRIQRLLSTALLTLLLSLGPAHLFAQAIPENADHEVYRFLSRQAQKGNIILDDIIQPLYRRDIAKHLSTLQDSSYKLSRAELAELQFYRKEYSEFDPNLKDTLTLLKKDQTERWRFLSVRKDGFLLQGGPLISIGTVNSNEKQLLKTGNGLQFWGHAGKRIGFYASFQDIYEKGSGIDSLRAFSPESGFVRTGGQDNRSLNYSELKAGLSFSWKNGAITIAKDNFLWGYGINGRPVLSDKAPSYPYIRLDYRPLKWLSFNYTHGWLQSNILDSARSYSKGNSVYGTNREIFLPKFIATHTLNFFPVKGLALSLGESMVYSDQLQVGYLIPLMFFKAYDHYQSRYKITSGANGQFFFQASSRNHLKNTHLYTTLFIDEVRMSSVFSSTESRNQLGFNLGASVTDVFTPYLTLGAEYTRINPFVYQNLIPAQNFTSHDYTMGDWMGNNADRLIAFATYTPVPRLKTGIYLQKVRKGTAGTIEEQYFQQPQPKFLSIKERDATQVKLLLSYELIHQLYLKSALTVNKEENLALSTQNKGTEFQFTLSFGL